MNEYEYDGRDYQREFGAGGKDPLDGADHVIPRLALRSRRSSPIAVGHYG